MDKAGPQALSGNDLVSRMANINADIYHPFVPALESLDVSLLLLHKNTEFHRYSTELRTKTTHAFQSVLMLVSSGRDMAA